MSMNGLANPTVIDLVNIDPTKDFVTLVIVQDAPWPKGQALLQALVSKVNTYMSFARLGTMTTQYPESAGKKVRLQLMSHMKLNAEVKTAVKNLGAALKKWETALEVVDVSG